MRLPCLFVICVVSLFGDVTCDIMIAWRYDLRAIFYIGGTHMSFRYYNAHPRKLSVDDCVKRSLALTTGISYRDIQSGLNSHKKVTGAKVFYEKGNPRSYVENILGFKRIAIKKESGGMSLTVAQFADLHPKGRYVVSIKGHWTACIDGVIYDTWDCSKHMVLSYYHITRFERMRVEKKYCFTAKIGREATAVTVYDGNGMFATRSMSRKEADRYISELYARGFFNFDEMGKYI